MLLIIYWFTDKRAGNTNHAGFDFFEALCRVYDREPIRVSDCQLQVSLTNSLEKLVSLQLETIGLAALTCPTHPGFDRRIQ